MWQARMRGLVTQKAIMPRRVRKILESVRKGGDGIWNRCELRGKSFVLFEIVAAALDKSIPPLPKTGEIESVPSAEAEITSQFKQVDKKSDDLQSFEENTIMTIRSEIINNNLIIINNGNSDEACDGMTDVGNPSEKKK